MGSAPNAAAAEVKHPVSQGMIQMLGVSSIPSSSAHTAFIVLTYQQPGLGGGAESGNRQPGRR